MTAAWRPEEFGLGRIHIDVHAMPEGQSDQRESRPVATIRFTTHLLRHRAVKALEAKHLAGLDKIKGKMAANSDQIQKIIYHSEPNSLSGEATVEGLNPANKPNRLSTAADLQVQHQAYMSTRAQIRPLPSSSVVTRG